MRFELTILGSGSALPTSLRNTTAQVLNVLERFFLIDCGEGCQLQLRRFSIPFNKINRIFISHLHGDHFYGLFGLLSTLNLMGRKVPMYIHAHPDLYPILKSVLNFDSETWMYGVRLIPLQFDKTDVIFEDSKVKVTSFPLRHSIPVCGFLFEEKPRQRKIRKEVISEYQLSIKEINELKNGLDIHRNDQVIYNKELTLAPPPSRKYAFATDTLKCSEIVDIVKDADLFYHEATYLHQDLSLARKTCHTTALQAAEIARSAGVGKLLVGHYSSRYPDTQTIENEAKAHFSNSIAVNDGDIFKINLR